MPAAAPAATTSPAPAPPSLSDVPQPGCGFISGTPLCNLPGNVAGAVSGTIDFIQNPIGYLAGGVQSVAIALMGELAKFTNQATQPDLTSDWWISAYKMGFAIGCVLLGFVLLVEIVQAARRKISPDDLMETVSIWLPAWFAGVLFGPALAQFVINGSGFLADGIIKAMSGYSGADAFKAVTDAAGNTNWFSLTGVGQAFMSLLVGICVLIAAIVVFISLCLQAVILYFASAVFAIGWVWIVTARQRAEAWRIPRLFIGIVFGKALLFFLLGVSLSLSTAATAIQGDGPGRDLALVVMSVCGMLLAAFAPLLLLSTHPLSRGPPRRPGSPRVRTGRHRRRVGLAP